MRQRDDLAAWTVSAVRLYWRTAPKPRRKQILAVGFVAASSSGQSESGEPCSVTAKRRCSSTGPRRSGSHFIRLVAVTPEILRKIADVAEKYRIPVLKMTSAARIAMLGVREEDVDAV